MDPILYCAPGSAALATIQAPRLRRIAGPHIHFSSVLYNSSIDSTTATIPAEKGTPTTAARKGAGTLAAGERRTAYPATTLPGRP